MTFKPSDIQRIMDEQGMSPDHPWRGGCGCWTCTGERVAVSAFPWSMPMCVCAECGNKRCPKATHHDRPCSGSNDPGQDGSNYGNPTAAPVSPAASGADGGAGRG